MERFGGRAGRLLTGVLLIYALLVATHLGEFWPFSIYPMFSKGGNPWSRAVVREVPADWQPAHWQPVPVDSLPGTGYSLTARGIDPIDLANFISKTETWHPDRVRGLRRMFYGVGRDHRPLMVMRVNGRIDGDDEVQLRFVPYAVLRQDTTLLNPDLPR